MIKSYCTETAYDIVDHAMQMFGGMGMTREMPLYLLSNKLRTMRIYDGPTEIHTWMLSPGTSFESSSRSLTPISRKRVPVTAVIVNGTSI